MIIINLLANVMLIIIMTSRLCYSFSCRWSTGRRHFTFPDKRSCHPKRRTSFCDCATAPTKDWASVASMTSRTTRSSMGSIGSWSDERKLIISLVYVMRKTRQISILWSLIDPRAKIATAWRTLKIQRNPSIRLTLSMNSLSGGFSRRTKLGLRCRTTVLGTKQKVTKIRHQSLCRRLRYSEQGMIVSRPLTACIAPSSWRVNVDLAKKRRFFWTYPRASPFYQKVSRLNFGTAREPGILLW